MKLQHLTVIFVIIILPITFIMSVYMQAQVDTIVLQSNYSAKLLDATYDAIKAFQLNTVNNRYSSVSDSKIRDIEAAINTFYSSLTTAISISEDNLKQFTPAILLTMYDGYYIYSRRQNTESYITAMKNPLVILPGLLHLLLITNLLLFFLRDSSNSLQICS